MSELKPCPWPDCDGQADLKREWSPFWVQCRACDCSGPHCDTEEEAIAAWNRRASTAAGGHGGGEAMFLMYPSSYPDEGEMLVVVGRSGVQETLATKMVFGAQSIADLTDDDCRELDCLMRQFDDPDEWTGADMCWSFEDGAINVTRLAPSIATAIRALAPTVKDTTK